MLPFERTYILSRRWVFGFITNPIRVDSLTAENEIVDTIKRMNGKRFKVRSPMGRFCDISEIYFERMRLTTRTRKIKCKISE
jgi:archaellum biogenesis ATPase FlaH